MRQLSGAQLTSIFPDFSIHLSYIYSINHFSSFIQTFIQSIKNNRIKQREKLTNIVIKGQMYVIKNQML